jgi:hypothetical protein
MELRMYFFVPYNISDIQKGIQAGHAALEYAFMYGEDREYKQFIAFNKTWVILNGGTTRYDGDKNGKRGGLNEIAQALIDNKIKFSAFEEPDLNNALSAICFIANERVWNKEKYPDWEDHKEMQISIGDKFFILHSKEAWLNFIGGEKNLFLRELLKDKHLA